MIGGGDSVVRSQCVTTPEFVARRTSSARRRLGDARRSSSSSTSSCSASSTTTRSASCSAAATCRRADPGHARAVQPRRLEVRAVRRLRARRRAAATSAISFLSSRPVTTEIREALWPTILLVGTATVLSMVIGIAVRDLRRLAPPERVRRRRRRRSRCSPTRCPTSGSACCCCRCSPCSWAGSRPAASRTPAARRPGSRRCSTRLHHMVLPAITLTLAYIGEYIDRDAVVDARHRQRGLSPAGARQGSARRRSCAAATPCRTRCCRSSACRRSTSGSCCRARSRSRRSTRGRGSGRRRSRRSAGPTSRCCRACSCCSARAVIVANLVADLILGYLDPRVGGR